MSNEQFSLCWDNFHKNMSSGMNSLLESEDLVDVTLAIEGQYLKAHKMILSVCSPYFRTLFSVNPCKHPIVFLKDISYVVMNDLLTFMYQGEVQVNQENLATFIKTAEALQIKGLTGDNNEVDDVVQETRTKRPAPTEEPKMKMIRKQSIQIPTKKTKLSPPSTETEIIVPPPITDPPEESKPEYVSTTNINNDIHFKMEPYDNIPEDESNDNNFDDGQVSQYIEEGLDGKDYIMEGSEEPQAGTSGDAMADSEDSIMNHREEFNRELNMVIATKHKNNVYLNNHLYERILNDVTNAKRKEHFKTSMDYHRLQRYDIVVVGNERKLIYPVSLNSDKSHIQYFIKIEELFDVIHNTHVNIGHGGRDKLLKELNLRYKNVTTEAIMLYLNLCKICQQKSRRMRNKAYIQKQFSNSF